MKSNSTFTTIFRKKSLEAANFSTVFMVNDSSIYLRALLSGNAYILDCISGVYRVHSSNITFNLDMNFINQNLIEKINVYKEIKQRNLLANPDEWIKNQIKLTINYFEENNNKRKRVFIMAYARKNFGDDLFIKMLLEKYPIISFYIKVPNYDFVKVLDVQFENLNVIIGNDTDEELYKMNEDDFDAYVYVGGSIFMEGGKVYNLSREFYDFVKRCKNKNIPFCYISSNYGPYQTDEYFKLSQKNFEACTDICFRDKYSFNLFKEIKSVRYAPDFAFSYPICINKKIPNSIGISVINFDIRNDLKDLNKDYEDFLINNIRSYINGNNIVYLYSFCEYEGDNLTIDRIMKHFKEKVIPVKYTGDLDSFLSTYTKMEYMICARFHAMVLSCISRQKIFVMSYSKKIDNVIDDLDLKLPIINFKNINNNIKIEKDDFVLINEEKILDIKNNAKNQDKVFSEMIF